jgi:tetratricopeptide (TPR) repeat protein
MINIFKKHPVTDPAFYDLLIKKQKKYVRDQPARAESWLALGRLHEAKIEMIHSFAKRQFCIRHFVSLYLLLVTAVVVFGVFIFSTPLPFLSLTHTILISFCMIFTSIVTGLMWSIRYPPSGWKHFNKAISIDPLCAEAYIHLGLIALRRYQKRTACQYLEQAIKLNVNNRKIEQELKSIYEKEFMAFFKGKSEKEAKLQEIIDHQEGEIKELRSKIASFENLVESLSDRADQAKWDGNQQTRLLTKKMKEQVGAIQTEHEKQVASIKMSNEAREEEKELVQMDFVKLTTEIMEAKAELEGMSLSEAKKSLEDTMGRHNWQALSEQTRTYLATAEYTFNLLKVGDEDPDYGLVGMELCKALETELNKRFVKPFIGYMNGGKSEFLRINQTGESKGKPTYFTYLARVVDSVNYPQIDSLSLGQYHFVLKHALNGDYALSEYANFLNEICGASGGLVGRAFLGKLETVTQRYRNAIAHQSPMTKKQYEDLSTLVFAGDKSLLKMIAPRSRSSL